ncbi:hypothetical protein RN001_013705 [Aquatica leii]|uniref:Uncharacterized protein n=1 Tax=Aquatica leii TaxID=1421715 RepID=A0AAN7NWL9_9COLE|nr:hypothetical protein RN001_013705 [Aquatica leii]
MNSISVKSFYGRKVTKLTALEEARKVIEGSKSAIHVVLRPPDAWDSANQDSDVEEIGDKPDDMFEPAGELEIEEDTDSDGKFKKTKQLIEVGQNVQDKRLSILSDSTKYLVQHTVR